MFFVKKKKITSAGNCSMNSTFNILLITAKTNEKINFTNLMCAGESLHMQCTTNEIHKF